MGQMAILQLNSTNPGFSFIIEKNPETGMLVKSIRKGKAFGWFSDPSVYNIYFKDAENEVSYQQQKDEQFEYLNATRYNSPIFPLNAVNDFFSTASKKQHDKDVEGYKHTITVNTVHVEHVRYLEYFQSHMPNFHLEYEEIAFKTYRIKVETSESVHQLLNYTNVLFLNLTFISEDYMHVTGKETIEKYIRSINSIDAPFYIRYLFVRNILTSKEKFFKYKESLENWSKHTINFAYGPTNIQRRDFITEHYRFDKPIVDIGCGDGAYALPFSRKINEFDYHAIDIDYDIREKLTWKLKKKEIENVIVYESLDHFLETYESDQNVDVLLTEVVEHMPIKTATKFVKQILKEINLEKLVLTTPNADFNQFYELTTLRHHDHDWEMTKDEFINWIETILTNTDYEYQWSGIGDCVNGIYTTQAAIIKRKGA
jgi:2-polyprenyl-3-methyl-5-hydroxy-6-metoxy-1,4-benzoquinol methylase